MSRIIAIIIFLAFCWDQNAFAQRRDKNLLFPISASPEVFSQDSILAAGQELFESDSNHLLLEGEQFIAVLRLIRAFNTVLLFDADGDNLLLKDPDACVNFTRLIPYLKLEGLEVNPSWNLDSILTGTRNISPFQLKPNKPLAIIFWSMTVPADRVDSPPQWEALIHKQWAGQINVIYINLDICSAWSVQHQESARQLMEPLLKSLKGTWFNW